jgi:hypothetical protein
LFGKHTEQDDQEHQEGDQEHVPVIPAFKEWRFIVILRYHNSNYRLVDLSNPVNTIKRPSAIPIINPTRILLMNIPRSSPSTIATTKAISPLRTLGFFSVIKTLSFYSTL